MAGAPPGAALIAARVKEAGYEARGGGVGPEIGLRPPWKLGAVLPPSQMQAREETQRPGCS